MFFEIHGHARKVVELDNLRDILKIIKVQGKKIVADVRTPEMILAEYDSNKRAVEVFLKLVEDFKSGKSDPFNLPEK